MEEKRYTLRRALRYLRAVAATAAPDYIRFPVSVTLTDGSTADLVNRPSSDGGALLGAYEIRTYTRGGQHIKTYRVSWRRWLPVDPAGGSKAQGKETKRNDLHHR